MSFVPIETAGRAARAHADKPYVGVYKNAPCKSGKPRTALVVRLASGLLVRLKWNFGDLIRVCEGTGSDAGVLLLAKATDTTGYCLSSIGKSRPDDTDQDLMFSISSSKLRHHALPTEGKTMQPISVFQIFNGQLQIMLPDYVEHIPH